MRLIATVQTASGSIDRVVSESTDIEALLSLDAHWQAHPATILTRIEAEPAPPPRLR